MHMIEEIAGKLKDPAETKNVSKVRLKLDGYHQAWLWICLRMGQYGGPLLVVKDKTNKMESKKEEIKNITIQYEKCRSFINGLQIQMAAIELYIVGLH